MALCAVASPEAALRSVQPLPGARSGRGAGVRIHVRAWAWSSCCATSPARRCRSPRRRAHYALVELATPRPGAGLRAALEAGAGSGAGGRHGDGRGDRRESEAQRAAIWRLREEHSEAQKREGAIVKNDVSVPVSEGAGVHPPRHRRLRGADARHPRGAVRPHGRRQHPLQPGTARGRGPRLVPRPGPRDHGRGERRRARASTAASRPSTASAG